MSLGRSATVVSRRPAVHLGRKGDHAPDPVDHGERPGPSLNLQRRRAPPGHDPRLRVGDLRRLCPECDGPSSWSRPGWTEWRCSAESTWSPLGRSRASKISPRVEKMRKPRIGSFCPVLRRCDPAPTAMSHPRARPSFVAPPAMISGGDFGRRPIARGFISAVATSRPNAQRGQPQTAFSVNFP